MASWSTARLLSQAVVQALALPRGLTLYTDTVLHFSEPSFCHLQNGCENFHFPQL